MIALNIMINYDYSMKNAFLDWAPVDAFRRTYKYRLEKKTTNVLKRRDKELQSMNNVLVAELKKKHKRLYVLNKEVKRSQSMLDNIENAEAKKTRLDKNLAEQFGPFGVLYPWAKRLEEDTFAVAIQSS